MEAVSAPWLSMKPSQPLAVVPRFTNPSLLSSFSLCANILAVNMRFPEARLRELAKPQAHRAGPGAICLVDLVLAKD